MTIDTPTDSEHLQSIILDHSFFSGLKLRYVPLLTDCASLVRVGVNERLFREGQWARHLYLLHSGKMALETFVPREGTTTVQIVEAGEALGLSWLFPPYQWQFSARSLDPSELVALDARSLRDKAQINPEFGYDLLTRMSKMMWERLQNTRRRMVELFVT